MCRRAVEDIAKRQRVGEGQHPRLCHPSSDLTQVNLSAQGLIGGKMLDSLQADSPHFAEG